MLKNFVKDLSTKCFSYCTASADHDYDIEWSFSHWMFIYSFVSGILFEKYVFNSLYLECSYYIGGLF